jgi:hypothetical protein
VASPIFSSSTTYARKALTAWTKMPARLTPVKISNTRFAVPPRLVSAFSASPAPLTVTGPICPPAAATP